MKQDGSGTAVLTANLSQSKSKLAAVMLLDSVNGYPVPSKADIRRELEQLADELQQIDGISNVTYTLDFNTFIASISWSFARVEDLNTITDRVFEKMKVTTANHASYAYLPATKTFSRTYVYEPAAKKEFDKLKAADQAVFENAIYTSIYRFDIPVVSNSNPIAKVSASKKAVMLQSPLMDLINGRKNLSNRIKLAN